MTFERCLNPACGGYRIHDEKKRANVNAQGEELSLISAYWLDGVAVLSILLSATPVFGGKGFFLLALGCGIGTIAVVWRHLHVFRVPLHHYTCELCGYQWKWREDQPKPGVPAVYTRPDLT